MISVCIATYNGEKFIKEQVASILLQLGEEDEVIISDDNSTDGTIDKIKEMNDFRIKVFYNNNKRGYSYNFENALSNANGDIIFLSDQDDVWLDNKVTIMKDFLLDYDFVVCNALIVDEDLNVNNANVFEFRSVKSGFVNNFYQIKYLGCTMAFKRVVLDCALPFPNNQTLVPHDSWFTLVGELFFKVKLVSNPLMYYRRHDSNVSNGGGKSANSLFMKIKIRIYVAYHLLLRAFRLYL